ncbi:MAG: hypothetical protein RLZZ450_6267 [Pseudomonadota bacterium]
MTNQSPEKWWRARWGELTRGSMSLEWRIALHWIWYLEARLGRSRV